MGADLNASITICKRMLSKLEIREILFDLERCFPGGSPLNSVWKLQEIVSRSSSPLKIVWFVTKIHDELKSKSLAPEAISVKNIKGKHIKSISDLIFMKLSMKGLLLGQMPQGLDQITWMLLKIPPFTLPQWAAYMLAFIKARLVNLRLVSRGPDSYPQHSAGHFCNKPLNVF